jgi:hypothetical protein
MKITIHEAQDQNGLNLFGAEVENVIIPVMYNNRITLIRRVLAVRKQVLNNNYESFLKLI